MPIPPNTTSATAVVIPSIPYSNIQAGIHDAGTTYTVWYKYTADGTEGVVGEMFRGDGVTYIPDVNLYIDNDATLLGNISANRMSQIPLLAGRTYFYEVVPNIGNPNPATLTVSLVKQPRLGAVANNIFIRAATILPAFTTAGYLGLGAGVVDHTTGLIKDYHPVLPVGEAGDYLPTGEFFFADEKNSPFDKIRIYNPTLPLTQRALVTYAWHSSFPTIRTWREGAKVLVVDKGQAPTNPVEYFTIDRNGVRSAITPVTAGSYGCTAAAMNPAGTFVYMAGVGGSIGAAIKKWDVVGGVFVADFAAGVANHIVTDILVMRTGEVVAMYWENATDDIFVRVYDSTGATLRTYIAPIVNYTSTSPRMGYANNDSISFWLFLHQNDGFSRFIEVKLSDVSVLTNISVPDSKYFTIDQGATPAYRLVISDSCPMVLFTTVIPSGPSGIYVIVPNKRNDDGLAIPAPIWKTALLP